MHSIAEQRSFTDGRIVVRGRADVDAVKRLQAETAAELYALLPANLDKVFKGEL